MLTENDFAEMERCLCTEDLPRRVAEEVRRLRASRDRLAKGLVKLAKEVEEKGMCGGNPRYCESDGLNTAKCVGCILKFALRPEAK